MPLRGTVTSFSVEKIQQACRAALVRVLADVPRILRLFQIARVIELHDLVVALDPFIGIATSDRTVSLADRSCSSACVSA